VLITIDTEFWPENPDFSGRIRRVDLNPERELRRDIYGITPRGTFGLEYQLDLFRAHRLRAVYFVEALSASVVGLEPLQRVVSTIHKAGQEVQLHVHTEWLKVDPNSILPGRTGQHIRQFALREQLALLSLARENLIAAGVRSVTAYRAGNFGASWETLRALASVGLTFDSSHNAGHLGRACDMTTETPLVQPALRHGVWELPVSCFEDWPGHYRHAQVSACSTGELTHALLEAWRRGWYCFVIVTHSNELLNRRKDGPSPLVGRRMRRLCQFLEAHRDKFETVTFADLNPESIPLLGEGAAPIRSNPLRTAWRMGEQLAERWNG